MYGRFARNFSLVTSCLFVGVFAASCGEDSSGGGSSSPVETIKLASQAELTDENVSLGEGFSSITRQGTDEFCLEQAGGIDEIRLNWLNDKTFWAEVLHSEEDIERDISGRLDGDVELGVIDAALDAHYDGTFDTTHTQEVLTLGLTIRTVEQYIVPSQDYTSTEVCDQQGDYLGFTEVCGDQYVAREVLGGICLMSADISDFTDEEKQLIKGELEVGVSGIGDLDVEGKWDGINSEVSQELRFWVDCIGIDDPTMNVLDNGELTKNGFSNFLHELQCGASTLDKDGNVVLSKCDGSDDWGYEEAYNAYARDPRARNHSSLGAVVDRAYQDYKFNGFIDFCVGEPLDQAETCYAEFMRTAHHKFEQVEDIVARTNEKVSNQSDYYWGEDEVDAVSKWTSFDTTAQDCKDQWKQKIRACYEQLAMSADEAEVCWACSMPDECNPGYLEDLEGGLPDVETHTSRRSPTERHPRKQGSSTPLTLGYTSDTLCTLSSVRGYFAGGGEKVIVENNNGTWDFSVLSQRTEDNEEVAASALCVDTQNFYDGNGNDFTIEDTASESSTGSTETETLNPYPHVAALTGIGGDFDGAGEHVSIVEPDVNTNNPWLLKVYTSASQTWGWGTAFGLDNPDGGQPGWVKQPEFEATNGASTADKKIYSKRMAASDEAYCYLTRVSGKFRGGGEKVRIYEEEGSWMLEIWAGCDDYSWGGLGDDCQERKHVEAWARCIPFDQSS